MWEFRSADALKAFASRLAPFVRCKDFIAVSGDLGAGKTTFAQGLLPALGVSDEVRSPTFGLIHTHQGTKGPVCHCDFYRLEPEEIEGTGFFDVLNTAVVLLEWPEKLRARLPRDRLEVMIESGEDDEARRIALKGAGSWQARLARFAEAEFFLRSNGFGETRCLAVRGDASTRSFARLSLNGRTAMLMDWPPRPDGPPVRGERSYSDIAHLASEGRPYLALASWLREAVGLGAPCVRAFDLEKGFFLIDDLGDGLFGALLAKGRDLEELYRLALEGLIAVTKADPPKVLPLPGGGLYEIPLFDESALEIEIELLLDWYFKLVRGRKPSQALRRSFLAAWRPLLGFILGQPKSLVLRDFHSPNLLLREGHKGLARLGVVDFQDAVWGHPAYDVVSLCQDARGDVPQDSEMRLVAFYCAGAERDIQGFDRAAFLKAYAILGAQRATKILGIFARLSLRDGKHDYLAHLPRVKGYLLRNLCHPALGALKQWYDEHVLEEDQPAERSLHASR